MKTESIIVQEWNYLVDRIIDYPGYHIHVKGDNFIIETPIGDLSTRFNTIREIHCFLSGIDHQKMVSALKKG